MEEFSKIPGECDIKMGAVMVANKDDISLCKEWTDKIFAFYQKFQPIFTFGTFFQ